MPKKKVSVKEESSTEIKDIVLTSKKTMKPVESAKVKSKSASTKATKAKSVKPKKTTVTKTTVAKTTKAKSANTTVSTKANTKASTKASTKVNAKANTKAKSVEEKSRTIPKTKQNLKLDVEEKSESTAEPFTEQQVPEEIPNADELIISVDLQQEVVAEAKEVVTKGSSTRGRKPKPKPIELEGGEPHVPKKRGRKPKPKTETVPTTTKRKGKNPKESYGLVQNEEEEDDPFFQNMTEEVRECHETPILKLNINSRDIEKIKDPNTNLMEGDSDLNIPHAFIPGTDSYSYFQSQNRGNIANIIKEEQRVTEKEIEDYRISREKEFEESSGDSGASKLLCQFIEHNRKGTWPTKSNYDCMWCRYSFENTPWAIPIKLKDDERFEVFGNFCAPGCAAAFIFDQYDDDEMWDRYALLNVLYQKVYDTSATVKSAPSTLFLKKLGGILTIEEFREISQNPNRNYFVKMPPMVSIIPSVEEIQQTSLFNDRGTHNHLNKELMMKASNELRLKRSKPIYDKSNTLDNYFHISSSELQS